MPSTQPAPIGPATHWLSDALSGRARRPLPDLPQDPLADLDLQRAIALACELSYDGLDGAPEDADTDPRIVAALNRWSDAMLGAIADHLTPADLGEGEDLVAWLQRLAGPVPAEPTGPTAGHAAPDDSMSGWLDVSAELWHLREEIVHRSLYQRHEADPHTFAIPRLRGRAKAALVTIQADEYGDGKLVDMHSELFGHTMQSMGLDPTPLAHFELLPASTLATSNFVSLLARSRARRGALMGHLALFEMASVPVMAAMSRTYARLGCNAWTRLFYDAHVVADAEHQRIAAHDLAGALCEDEPHLEPDLRFGAAGLAHVEGRMTSDILGAWNDGRSSLLAPLDDVQLDDLDAGQPVTSGRDPRQATIAA